MLERFEEKLISLLGIDPVSSRQEFPRVLIAVSGGIDSMSLAHLFNKIKYPHFAVATVNFKLRVNESDLDEALVRSWALENSVRFFSTSFDTIEYSLSKGISTQMAARELRYNWFFELMNNEGYDALAIAHNLNDTVETLFLNILRGTGVDGLAAIRELVETPFKGKKIVRPLLGFTRKEIEEYAAKESVEYRHDSSNFENHYSRNKLRNLVFPHFEQINSSFLQTIEKSICHFTAAGDILRDLYLQKRNLIVSPDSSKERVELLIEPLLSDKYADYWLFMLLEEYNFNSAQVKQISASLCGEPGKIFFSPTHRALKDRDKIIVTPLALQVNPTVSEQFNIDEIVEIFIYERTPQFIPVPSDKIFFMDAGRVKFPLSVRRWKSGDKFHPLGMACSKKVSDFLTDIKRDRFTKEERCVLISADEKIICLLGERIDDRFKITTSTSRVLEVHLLK